MCWNFVSESLGKQHVMQVYESHRKLIEQILDDRYSELRNLVDHMYSSYVTLGSEVGKGVKKDRKAHLTMRWMKSLNSYLDGSPTNANMCRFLFTGLPSDSSTGTIWSVT